MLGPLALANRSYPHVSVGQEAPGPVDDSEKEQIGKVCREVLAPLIKADGGGLFLVGIEGDDVHIYLAGACAGCPGASITRDDVILPALRSIVPTVRLFITTGVKAPEEADRAGVHD
jgi:Fe-S cluster biogenesis protein NfuA